MKLKAETACECDTIRSEGCSSHSGLSFVFFPETCYGNRTLGEAVRTNLVFRVFDRQAWTSPENKFRVYAYTLLYAPEIPI